MLGCVATVCLCVGIGQPWVVSRELRLHGNGAGPQAGLSCVLDIGGGPWKPPPCPVQLGHLRRLRRGLLVHKDPSQGTFAEAEHDPFLGYHRSCWSSLPCMSWRSFKASLVLGGLNQGVLE